MQRVILVIISLVISFFSVESSAASKSKTKTPVKVKNIKPLNKGQGYLLVKMDVSSIAPSLTVDSLKNNGDLYLESGESRRLLDEEFTINLKDVDEGLYLLRLPAGLYQITQVNVPFFNLPFELDTSKKTAWRFSIAEGKTNYIGTLFVDQERSSKLVNVALYNRIATDRDQIKSELPDLLVQAELRNGAGVRDDFYEILSTQD